MDGMGPLNESCAQKRCYGYIKHTVMDIVETVRLALTRKRGPKKPGASVGFQLEVIGRAA
jgi:hypothetical protein